MSTIVLLYSTTDGQTLKIANYIKSELEISGHSINLMPINHVDLAVMNSADKILIGASVRYGKHKKEVVDFITQHEALLTEKISGFFSVNLVARKPNKNTPDTNPYLKKFLTKIPWQPNVLAVFAGRIDYPSYNSLDRLVIRLIMLLTKGPTDPSTVIEFTDWKKVKSFAKSFALL